MLSYRPLGRTRCACTMHNEGNSLPELGTLVVGEAHKPENRVFYPRNPE
jgi:hypothetical protein